MTYDLLTYSSPPGMSEKYLSRLSRAVTERSLTFLCRPNIGKASQSKSSVMTKYILRCRAFPNRHGRLLPDQGFGLRSTSYDEKMRAAARRCTSCSHSVRHRVRVIEICRIYCVGSVCRAWYYVWVPLLMPGLRT